jgi:lipoprotein-anchoring transpeptidase ErfK/SrfK
MRTFIFLFLVGMWIVSLFAIPYSVKAQAEHIVQPGEDMHDIAALYQITAPALAWENDLSLPVQLVPGQRLRLPSSAQLPVLEPSATEPAMPEAYPQAEPQAAQAEPQWQEELTGEKWIDIDLSDQILTAVQGDTAVASFWISSGVSDHPTVTGSFRVWAKVAVQDMSGGSRAAGTYYYAEDVPWVQYFYADYSIHGAYWHNNFGQPASHGCVNMRIEDARWLFEWAEPSMDPAMVASGTWFFPAGGGTRVEVHE